MASSPSFVATAVVAMVQISTANTNRDGTGTIGTVVTGASGGTRIDRITVIATGTTTAGMVRLFIDNTTNVRLWREVSIAAVTPSATAAVFRAELLIPNGLVLPNGYILKASTHNAETFNVIAEGGEF